MTFMYSTSVGHWERQKEQLKSHTSTKLNHIIIWFRNKENNKKPEIGSTIDSAVCVTQWIQRARKHRKIQFVEPTVL